MVSSTSTGIADGHLHFGARPDFGLEVDWAFVDGSRLREHDRIEKSRDAVLARAGYSADRFGTCCAA
jgi:hypothetical protein